MKRPTLALAAFLAALLAVGCTAVARHRVLTRLFDGVPPLAAEPGSEAPGPTAAVLAGPQRRGESQHGPYAAGLCDACHLRGASNGLVAPPAELCSTCHAPESDRRFVHGPVAAGLCAACHDPHDSRHEHLLVSAPDDLCLGCHERQVVSRIENHADFGEGCLTCHEAHGSQTRYLLK